MSLFGSLYLGTSGLQSSQEALNVTAHNVTNTDTKGYTRQQVSYGTREYNTLSKDTNTVARKQTGLGVYISEVRQVRDRFVDAMYRNQNGRQGFYDVSYSAIEEIEEILGELDGPTFENAMNDFWYSASELAKDPTSEVNQSMFVQYANSFVEAAQNVYKDMEDYQNKLNDRVAGMVDEINSLGWKINKLNEKIRAIEAGGVENPNDLLDQRNQALDDLSKLVNITYKNDFYGNVIVKIEGHDFVTMNTVSEMGYQAEDDESVGTTGFYNVFWKDSATVESRDENGEPVKYVQDTVRNNPNTGRIATGAVFNWDLEISSKLDTDVGELKGLLLARGSHRGTFADLGWETDTLEQKQEKYDQVKDSIMVNIMSEFDGLVHNLVTSVNSILSDAANNATYPFASFGYMADPTDGKPIQLFHRISEDDTLQGEDINDSATWFSTMNLSINQDLLQYPTHLGLRLPDGSEDVKTAERLRDAFTDENYTLNPTLTNKTSLKKYYANFVAQIANSGNVYKNLKENQDLTVEAVESNRQGSIGVATDEELSNMIKFQNAYNASSRFINVIDECMEHIINTLGT